jgi:hypothetical protein
MRVIAARSNYFIPSKCKKATPLPKREMSLSGPTPVRRGATPGIPTAYLHFSPVPTETAERSPRKNAGMSLFHRSSWLSAKAFSMSVIP